MFRRIVVLEFYLKNELATLFIARVSTSPKKSLKVRDLFVSKIALRHEHSFVTKAGKIVHQLTY